MPSRKLTRLLTTPLARPLVPAVEYRASAVVPFPSQLYDGLGDYWIGSDLTRLFTDSAETTNVAANGDPIGSWKGQLDAFSIRQSTTGSKPLWVAADNSVDLQYLKSMVDLIGGNIAVANEPFSLFVYAKLTDYAYGSSGDDLAYVLDTSGYPTAVVSTGGYGGGSAQGHALGMKANGYLSWNGAVLYGGSSPDQTSYRAITYSRSDSASTRGVWGHNYKPMSDDPDNFGIYTPRNSNSIGLYGEVGFGHKRRIKMIAAGRVALSSDDIANLIAYAESLP